MNFFEKTIKNKFYKKTIKSSHERANNINYMTLWISFKN